MNEFMIKTKIFTGQNCLKKLTELSIKKACIICDPYMKESRKVDQITGILEESGAVYQVFSEVIPDPTIEVVTKAVENICEFLPDTVIAFGGGSAIDTAKAVSYIYTKIQKQKPICLIAIPTTSGTGSEVTSFAVISDPKAGAKYPLVSSQMIPDIALLDPVLTVSVPAHITADTGIDVLTHALEAIVSADAQVLTDAGAEKAIRLVWKYLEPAVKNGMDMESRMYMHSASCLAGIAFNQASLGICHSMAHALGARFHISHGRSNAVLLPHIIRYNAGLDTAGTSTTLRRYAEIAEMLGIWGSSDKSTVCMLIQKIKNLIKRIGIPQQITGLGIGYEEYAAAVPDMAAQALADKCLATNPRVPDITALKEIYMHLVRGDADEIYN